MKNTSLCLCCLLLLLNVHTSFSYDWQTLDRRYEALQAKEKHLEALSAAQELIAVAKQQFTIDSKEYHKSLQNMAKSYQVLKQWDEALEYYKELLRREISRLAKIDLTMSATIQSITKLYDFLYDIEYATSVYEKATERLALVEHLDTSLYTQLADYYTQALTSQAPPTVSQALVMTEELTGTDQSTLTALVSKLPESSQVQRSQPPPSVASDNQKNNILHQLIENCTKNRENANFSGAIESCGKLYKLRKTTDSQNTIEHARTCYALGYLYFLSSNYKNAVNYYQEGLTLWEKNNFEQNEEYVEALYNTGSALQVNEEYQHAKSLLIKAEKAGGRLVHNEDSLYPGILAMLAAIQRLDGDYTASLATCNQYRDYYLKRKYTDPTVWLNYYLTVGLVYEQLERWKEADKAYIAYDETAINLIARLFKYVTISSEKQVSQSFIGFRTTQDFYYSYCQKRKHENPELTDQMYNNELMDKGLVLRTLRRKINQIQKSGDTQLIDDFNEWIDIRQKLAKLTQLAVSDRRISVSDIEKKAIILEKRMQARLQDELKPAPTTYDWREVQKKLELHEAAVEFVHFQYVDIANKTLADKILYGALVIRQGYKHPRFVNLFTEKEFREFLDDTKEPDPFTQIRRMYTWLPGQYNGVYKGDVLYKLIWSPIEPALQGIKKIYYSPSGLLHRISFNAIPIAQEKTLISKYSLHQLSSNGFLAEQRPASHISQKDTAILFGGMAYDLGPEDFKRNTADHMTEPSDLFIRDRSFDWTRSASTAGSWPYLEGSLEEVEQINALFHEDGKTVHMVTREKALEERFKEAAQSHPQILHIATHGFFFPPQTKMKKKQLPGIQGSTQVDSEDAFRRSGLLFAGANNTWTGNHLPNGLEDGILTSSEISKLNLNDTKLVVLSACETGLGDLAEGEGVYGLQRAFKLAGVDNIIMSLWQIPDMQTIELMNLFYSEWLSGKDLGDAFHAAQQGMAEKYEPYFWGAFVLLQ